MNLNGDCLYSIFIFYRNAMFRTGNHHGENDLQMLKSREVYE